MKPDVSHSEAIKHVLPGPDQLAALEANINHLADPESFAKVVQQHLDDGGLHGCALAVVDPKGCNYSHGFGLRNDTDPITSQTIFRIASITKPIAATALLIAALEELIDMNTCISKQVVQDSGEPLLPFKLTNPNFPEEAITPKQVLDFYSTIHDDWNVLGPLYHSDMSPEKFLTAYLSPDGEMYSPSHFSNHKPGTFWEYSDVSATLVAYLVQRAADMPFEDYIRTRLFEPLGMTATWRTSDLPAEMQKNVAMHYEWHQGAYKQAPVAEPYPFYPSGGLFSNVDNLAKYLCMLINDGDLEGKRVLPADMVHHMGKGPDLTTCTYQESSMWFRSENYPGVRIKFGSSLGVSSVMMVDLPNKLGYIGVANGRNPNKATHSVACLATCLTYLMRAKPPTPANPNIHGGLIDFS